MVPELLKKKSLFVLLFQLDTDLASEHRSGGCLCCGGPLHVANYQRKPRGEGVELPDEILLRHSFCCGQEGCRRRSLPPSLRFLGRRVYWGVVILLVVSLRQQQPDKYSVRRIRTVFGISRETIERWIETYSEVFPNTSTWQQLRGRFGIEVLNHRVLSDLLSLLLTQKSPFHAVITCLGVLSMGELFEVENEG